MIVLLAFVACAVDVGYMCVVRAQAQNCVDIAPRVGSSLVAWIVASLKNNSPS